MHPNDGTEVCSLMETKVEDLTVVEFQSLISDTMRATLKDLIEDVSALSSPEYLKSIEEARNDYREGSAGWICEPCSDILRCPKSGVR